MVPIGNLLRQNSKIQVLDLLNCGLLDQGIRILADALAENSTLKHLYLNANGITPVGLAYICEYFKKGKSELQTLFLGCNRIGNEGAMIFADCLRHAPKLVRINLASSRIGAEGMASLTEALISHNGIQMLDLGYSRSTVDLGELGNQIEDEGAILLSKYLQSTDSLISLNITHNHITQRGMKALVEAVKANKSLVSLDYVQYGVSLNEFTLIEMRQSLERNRSLMRPADVEEVLIPEHISEIYSVYRTH